MIKLLKDICQVKQQQQKISRIFWKMFWSLWSQVSKENSAHDWPAFKPCCTSLKKYFSFERVLFFLLVVWVVWFHTFGSLWFEYANFLWRDWSQGWYFSFIWWFIWSYNQQLVEQGSSSSTYQYEAHLLSCYVLSALFGLCAWLCAVTLI